MMILLLMLTSTITGVPGDGEAGHGMTHSLILGGAAAIGAAGALTTGAGVLVGDGLDLASEAGDGIKLGAGVGIDLSGDGTDHSGAVDLTMAGPIITQTTTLVEEAPTIIPSDVEDLH